MIGAKVKLRGKAGEVERFALVDTGATFSIMGRELAEDLGVTYVPEERRRVSLQALCCGVEGELALLEEMLIEGVYAGVGPVVIVELSSEVKRALGSAGLAEDFIIGLSDLMRTGYVVDLRERRLRYVGHIML